MSFLNPRLMGFWKIRARGRTLYGGRASSKSWDAAGMAIHLSRTCKVKVLCVRQFQSNIGQSVYVLIKNRIEAMNLADEFLIQSHRIVHVPTGSEFMFFGLARNTAEIKSMEGIDILWVEEAEGLTEEQWEILEPTIRKQGSQIWIIFNPRYVTDFSYQNFVLNPPKNWVVRKINYDENPFISHTMLEAIAAFKERKPDEYPHIYLGHPRDSSEDAIIKRRWIEAAIGAADELGLVRAGNPRLGFDIADAGGDRCVNVEADGPIVYYLDQWRAMEDDLVQSCRRTQLRARQAGAEIVYDSVGVGAMAGSKFQEENDRIQTEFKGKRDAKMPINQPVKFRKFSAGSTELMHPKKEYMPGVTNKQQFANIKAQAWWLLADRFRNTYMALVKRVNTPFDPSELISLDPDLPHLEALITELSTPQRRIDASGRVAVESKEELKKRGIASTDLADGFVMANWPEKQIQVFF